MVVHQTQDRLINCCSRAVAERTTMFTDHQSNPRRVVVEADSRGRISLAKSGIKNTQLVIEELGDGSLAIHPAVVLTTAEARHYSSPEAVAALDRA